jgi:P4 family phage/plasmid primase-like protien
MNALTHNEIAVSLHIARCLVASGIPVFVAYPDPSKPTGFALPLGWEQTPCDLRAVDTWQPGMALGAVMGHGLDLIDLDPRSGADLGTLNGSVPTSYGLAATPSGGVHSFVRSLGVRSRDKVAPGIDVKSGDAAGKGRGCAFIAPTIRASKVDGSARPYRWVRAPDLSRLAAHGAADDSGRQLAALITALRAREPDGQAPTPAGFMRAAPWTLDVTAVLAEGRHAGVIKLVSGLRGRGGWRLDDALRYMRETVWPHIDQSQAGHEYPLDEFEQDITDVWTRYPDGHAERATEANTMLGPAAAPGTPTEPGTPTLAAQVPGHVALTDTFLADRVAEQCLRGRYIWVSGMEWLRWNEQRWVSGDTTAIIENVRQWTMSLYTRAQQAGADAELLKLIKARQDATKIEKVVKLCRGIECIRAEAAQLDARPELLNTPHGVVNLATGDVVAHDPSLLLTKITRGSYRPDYTHDDWATALDALPEAERTWFQSRIGQAITGHPTPDGLMPILQGGGENGKSALTTDGLLPALGDYAAPASPKLFQGHNEHSTERADLRGQRLLIAEEMTEGRALNTTALKQIQDVGEIKARYLYRDNITFSATHSLFVTTNYMPVVNETDHGTWRRLAVLKFPYTFRKPGEPLDHAHDRAGDPGLKMRIREGLSGQHDAIVTWAIEGAIRWYNRRDASLRLTETISTDTLAWRGEADYILGFWNERLTPDPDACIGKMDTFDEFNDWLRSNGKTPWSQELFASRFKEHVETRRHGVEETRPRKATNLVKRNVAIGMPRANENRPRIYTNVRWRLSESSRIHDQPSQTVTLPSGPTGLPSNANESRPVFEAPQNGPISDLTCVDQPPVRLTQPKDNFATPTRACAKEVSPGVGSLDQTRGDRWFEQLHMASFDLETLSVDDVDVMRGAKKPRKARAPKADKEATKHHPIACASGPLVVLPALVVRSGEVWPVTLDQVETALKPAIESALTVDVETTGYPVGHVDYALRTVQLGNAQIAVVFDVADPAQAEYVRAALARAPKLHAHSATADIVPLAVAGLIDADRAWQLMHDTVIPAKLADPASTGSDPALKQLADAVLPDAVSTSANVARAELFKTAGWLTEIKPATPRERSGWAQVDPRCRTMVRYAASDVLDTAALAVGLPAVDGPLLDRERAVQRLTARVTHLGVRVDGAHVRELLAVHHGAKAEAAGRVQACGVANPGSAAQIGAHLLGLGAELPQTPTGRPSVTAGVLETLGRDAQREDVRAFVAAVLAYREHDTAIGLFLEPYQQLVERGDGRARPTIYTLAADTGRMSCVRPNLQQVPREGGFRECITADPGELFISADFSSVELRVMAALSQDPTMMRMIHEGTDIHSLVAEHVFGPEWTKGDRYMVKRGVFGWAYGGSIPTLARQVGCREAIMSSVVDVLADIAPQYVAWSHEIKNMVRQGRTEFRTYSGRIAYLPKHTPHKAPNYCIQGTARELLVDGLLRWQETPWGNARLFPVHDEIVVAVPAEDAEKATQALVESMTSSIAGVPIVASPSAPSVAWADAA